MKAQLNILKQKRGQIKASLTRFETFLNSIDVNNLNENIVKELSHRLDIIKGCFDTFNEIQNEMDILNPDCDTSENERSFFENLFFSTTSKADVVIDNFHKKLCERKNNNPSENGSVISSGSVHRNIKLPTIKLPIFNGKYDRWLEFRDLFHALVDGNHSLSNIEKFYHLKTSLGDEPRKIIAKLDMTSENYQVAWQLLKGRYENKNLMIHNHIKSIFERPKIQIESHSELRNLTDAINDHLLSLKSLGENIEAWDRLIIYIITQKIDAITRREWESYKIQNELPTMVDMQNFLNERCQILEKLSSDNPNKNKNTGIMKYDKFKKQNASYSLYSGEVKCYFCNHNHTMYVCETFLKYSIPDRIAEAKKRNLCLNCFSPKHKTEKCQFRKCIKCRQKHNVLIHLDDNNQASSQTNAITEESHVSDSNSESVTHYTSYDACFIVRPVAFQVLLSTAIVNVKANNNTFKARVLLDSGSQSNFVTESFCNKAGVAMQPVIHTVKGVGEGLINIKNQTQFEIMSLHNSFNVDINCLVINQITGKLPKASFDNKCLNIPNNLNLADPTFNETSEIDILIGAHIFWQVLTVGQRTLGTNLPMLHNTKFGWIIAGNIGCKSDTSVTYLATDSDNEINNLVSKFWTLENVNNNHNKSITSKDNRYCEEYFERTTTKDETGRFVVRIPFKDNLSELGRSKDIAKSRFFNLEKRLIKNRELREHYIHFMEEYKNLGHMSELSEDESEKDDGYFIPHHAVLKSSSLTTKCRVVFNASCPTDSGLSLNDVQYVGPALQNDIFDILARFRTHKFVIAGDISKMYRQILVNPSDQCYQKVFWRSDINKPLKTYLLRTVSYGTAAAPYLAVRTLLQIANENEKNAPVVSSIIKNDFYIDDLLTGANTQYEIVQIQKDISELLKKSGFELRKWLCNDNSILHKFSVNTTLETNFITIGDNENNKTLGIYWNASNDFLQYSVSTAHDHTVTKRNILSVICQIYDPLGLINPIIVFGKLFIQELWKLKQSWDAEVPEPLKQNWLNFQDNLIQINNFKIPRNCVCSEYSVIEIHGFSDASEKAYGGVLYIRCLIANRGYFVSLLCSKSRVAPLKQISLPRLELCGAVLLANLMDKACNALKINFHNTFYWTDSTITLSWIKAEPTVWKTFVANRVSEIQNLSDVNNWYHVKGTENPADLLSRGVLPQNLEFCTLWWHGPPFLLTDNTSWNGTSKINYDIDIPERKTVSSALITVSNFDCILSLINHISNFSKLLRITAFVQRFIYNIKSENVARHLGSLKISELDNALLLLIKTVQLNCFRKEYLCLRNGKDLPKDSKILNLKPFLCNEIIRVGGRLVNSEGSFDKKHQILLPKNNHLTEIIIRNYHINLLHCGSQMLLCSVRDRFWPIDGRNICKKIIRTCVKCFRVKPIPANYIMGNLPPNRVNPSFQFLNVGIDYGGPFLIRDRRGRGCKTSKCYISLFVCMSSKAIHLELVTGLTTEAFIACSKRFMSRRGKPQNIYSDNGSNFVGAKNTINDLYTFLSQKSETISSILSTDRVKWHFIPANSPSFGGLWEAGIKSCKFHLKRVIGDSTFTYEDFSTVLCQVESILNSRPLCPLSNDPQDLVPLTPAHLLIGRSLIAIPEEDLTSVPSNRLDQYQNIQVAVQSFWKRWSKEYLSELQVRAKWKSSTNVQIKPDLLVLLKDDKLPPLRWSLGRIVNTYPGDDGVVRVVDVQTANGLYRRAVNRLCILPHEL